MRELANLDELDLDLISALQIAPRAPWALVGEVLQVDAATAARRWERLSEAGAVWLTCYPGPHYPEPVCMAFIEVDCAQGQVLAVAEQASRLPAVVTAEHVTGGRDLYFTVMVGDLGELTEFLLGDLQRIPGAQTTRVQVVTELYAQGGDWNLGGLDAAQQERIRRSRPGGKGFSIQALRPVDRNLLRLLANAPRASYTDLAKGAGISVSTARRRVDALLASGMVGMRCEVSRVLAEVPMSATVWANVPPADLPGVAALIASLPETRVCAGITGGMANLLFSVWLRRPKELQLIERRLGDLFPQVSIVDRALCLRHVKRAGRLLHDGDLAGDMVPLAMWND
ncbi:AsnC family transcriptional regulator [Saccharopolyspora sp. NPDC050642]|uniref:Lrp/AsnC family transcriptional regulator n=1 Tax=Saccharopolyspora sp. NPDC050642 TaxID=3157099 RepID=UPI00340543DD